MLYEISNKEIPIDSFLETAPTYVVVHEVLAVCYCHKKIFCQDKDLCLILSLKNPTEKKEWRVCLVSMLCLSASFKSHKFI